MTVLVAVRANMVDVADGPRVRMWSERWRGHGRELGTRRTGYAISYNKYGAPVTASAGADCARKAARFHRAAKQRVHVVSGGQDVRRG